MHESKANVVNQILETEQKLRFGATMGTKILPDMTETSYIKLRTGKHTYEKKGMDK